LLCTREAALGYLFESTKVFVELRSNDNHEHETQRKHPDPVDDRHDHRSPAARRFQVCVAIVVLAFISRSRREEQAHLFVDGRTLQILRLLRAKAVARVRER
jgi:hypothetical protein